jgi:hypothetical protein
LYIKIYLTDSVKLKNFQKNNCENIHL